MKTATRWLTPAWTAAAGVALVGAVGYFPTVRLAGELAWHGLLAGCAVGMAANWIGLASMFWVRFDDPKHRATATLTAMGVRFAAVLMLGLASALSGWFELAPLLIWVVISHLVALFVETMWLVRVTQDETGTDR